MDAYKLKIKVGEHEFEAEGPPESVERQFQMWKELIATASQQKYTTIAGTKAQETSATSPEMASLPLERIMRAEGRVISLTAPPELAPEAVLLLLLGQRQLRSNESVTGSEMMDGLQLSGFRMARVDRLLDNLATDGLVIRSGAHRGTRYRLSNTGLARAQAIAREVIGRVA
jgi:hypothetical protein